MPLNSLQDRIARTSLALPEAHTLALAGGAAMIAHVFVTRETKDIGPVLHPDDLAADKMLALWDAPDRSEHTMSSSRLTK